MTQTYGTWDRVCGVCRVPLTRRYFPDTGKVDWLHGLLPDDGDAGHAAVPVPASEFTSLELSCDVCSAPQPQWRLPVYGTETANLDFEDVTASSFGVDPSKDGAWLLCDDCQSRVQARDVKGMVRQALQSPHMSLPIQSRQERPLIAGMLAQQYQKVLERQAGPVQRIDPVTGHVID